MKKQEPNGAPPAGRGSPLGAKPSYGRLNVNQSYPPAKTTGSAPSPSAARPAGGATSYGSRMLVLGKGSKPAPSSASKPGPLGAGKVVAPRPVNLPSMKSEVGGLDSAPAPWAAHSEPVARSQNGTAGAAGGAPSSSGGAGERDGPWARRDEGASMQSAAPSGRPSYPPSLSGTCTLASL